MTSNKPGHPPLDQKLAATLVDKLATDDAFRSSFSDDPASALQSLGFKGDPTAMACIRTTTLASKDEFAKTSQALVNHLTTAGNHTVVFAFESGEVASAVSKNDSDKIA